MRRRNKAPTKVIGVRLTDEELILLDELCIKLDASRSEALRWLLTRSLVVRFLAQQDV